MSSFKTQTGPGTIYDQLLHPPTDSAAQDPTHEDPAGDGSRAVTSRATALDAGVQTGLEATKEASRALTPAFEDPGS